MKILHGIAAVVAAAMFLFATHLHAQAPERRFALVIGNGEYKAGRLPTAANDAGLIAESLRAAGFDVTGARDLDQDTLRRSMREFLDKIAAAGEQAVALIYLTGYGLQFEGENYIVPVDAGIRRDQDIPIEAVRISDFTRPLAGMPGAVKLFIVDAARQHPFTPAGTPLASGLALIEPDPGILVAFNAAPGSIAPIEPGPYGAYAQALAEMIGTGGLGLDDLFTRLRLRVNEKTGGLAVPWYASKITQPFLFMERAPDAPAPPQTASNAQLQNQPLGQFQGDQEAYAAAVARDTLQGYQDFLAAYPDSPLAARVRALIAVRREAMTWRRAVAINTQEAFWSYLQRYPQGAHVADARRRLSRLAAAFDPPAFFTPMADLGVPPPPPDEVAYLDQPQIVFDGPGFLPPPPVPVYFLPPPPPAFIVLAPPPPPIGAFFLPVPLFAARPWGRPPAFVLAPPPPPIQRVTINNVTIVNQRVGGGTMPATTLPATVVTRINSGALKPPPPGAPPPAPIHQVAALTGTGPLGHPTTLPPGPARPGGIAVPAGAATGVTPLTRTPGPATATVVPGTARRPVNPATNARPPGPASASVTPGAASTARTPPTTTRPLGPAFSTAVPGNAPAGVPPGTARPLGPATATFPPGGPVGRPIPGPPQPGRPVVGSTNATGPTGFNGSSPQGQPLQERRPATVSTATTTAPGANFNRPPTPPPSLPHPPQVVSRPPPVVQPPAVVRAPPPPVVAHAPQAPPVAARQAPAARRCVVQNGKQVCS